MTDLVSRRLRNEVREWLSAWSVLGRISDLFTAEGFVEAKSAVVVSGQRRELVESFYASTDWTIEGARRRFLRVCEGIIADAPPDSEPYLQRLKKAFQRDGYEIDELGCISVRGTSIDGAFLSQLRDESAIRLHLGRIQDAIDQRPEEVIGAAKDLIEATVKYVLQEMGEPVPKADLPHLARLAQRKLALHPEVLSPTAEGGETLKRVLGALNTIAIGIAELRNLYGTGHGQASRPRGLHQRHARLAAQAAQTYITFLLETLHDPRAPWQRETA